MGMLALWLTAAGSASGCYSTSMSCTGVLRSTAGRVNVSARNELDQLKGDVATDLQTVGKDDATINECLGRRVMRSGVSHKVRSVLCGDRSWVERRRSWGPGFHTARTRVPVLCGWIIYLFSTASSQYLVGSIEYGRALAFGTLYTPGLTSFPFWGFT
jgi:hypothetical protein